MRLAKKIIVAPLDWGLGHATRCIPIVHELLDRGAEVLLASDGRALTLLQKEFPRLPYSELPAYNVEYLLENMVLNVAIQLPKIAKAVWSENKAINLLAVKHKANGIISDNRYGCYSTKIRSVFISHQINIKVGNLFLEWAVNYFNSQFINKFDQCWIPDVKDAPNLSGELSHPLSAPVHKKTKYIGPLSRMHGKVNDAPTQYEAVVVLSGPEPQRTKFEALVLCQLQDLPGNYLVVQGKPEVRQAHGLASSSRVTVVPFLTATELNEAILASNVFVGRSGYSTVMDLVKMKKPALLIPTPGQTEQEYLASKFSKEAIFQTQQQSKLNLATGILEAKKRFQFPDGLDDKASGLSNAVEDFLQAC